MAAKETDKTIINKEGLEWVWLDLDDTLVDFHANSDAALKRVYEEWNLPTYYNNVEEWLQSYHAENAKLWKLYDRAEISQADLRLERFRIPLVKAGVGEEDAARISLELDPAYLDYLALEKRTVPGAKQLLEGLRLSGYRIGILSNGFNGVQQKKLVSAGLDGLVDLVVLSDEIGINKPDVRLYNYAMERAGAPSAASHAMVGDNPATDISGALNAGWQAVLFAPGGYEGERDKFAVVERLDSVLPLFLR